MGKISKIIGDELQRISKMKQEKSLSIYPKPKTEWAKQFDFIADQKYKEAMQPYEEDVYPDGVSAFDAMFDDIAPIGKKTVYPDIDPYDFDKELNFKFDQLPGDNQGRFLSQESINNLYDMYTRGISRSSMVGQLPSSYTSRKSYSEDFGSGNIETEFDHIFTQTYKDELAKKLGVPSYVVSVDRYRDFPYVENIQTGELRDFDGVINELEVLKVPRRMVADEFYNDPSKLISSAREFQGFVDDSQAASLSDFMDSAKYLKEAENAANKPNKPKLSIVKSDKNNLTPAVIPAGIGFSSLFNTERSQAAQNNPYPGTLSAYPTSEMRAPVHPNAAKMADYFNRYNQSIKDSPLEYILPEAPTEWADKLAYDGRTDIVDKIKAALGLL